MLRVILNVLNAKVLHQIVALARLMEHTNLS